MRFGYSTEQKNSLLERAKYASEIGELTIADTDWILMQGSTLRSLIEGINNVRGSEGGSILFDAGRLTGRNFTQTVINEGTSPEEVPMWLEVFFTQGGWGKITARADFVNKTAVVVIDNCATARQVKSKESSCHFIRGYIAGICEILFKTNVECVETRCMSKGNAYCEFRVQTKTH